MEDMT